MNSVRGSGANLTPLKATQIISKESKHDGDLSKITLRRTVAKTEMSTLKNTIIGEAMIIVF